MDAHKMFTTLTHTALLSLYLLSLTF